VVDPGSSTSSLGRPCDRANGLDFESERSFSAAKSRWIGARRWRAPPGECWGSLIGELTSLNADELINIAASDPSAPLFITVDTDGGSISAAFSIYEALRSRPGPVSAHVSKRCHSAGIVAFLGADERTSSIGASFIIHSVADAYARRGRATAAALRAAASELAELDNEMLAIIEWRTRLPNWQCFNALRDERLFTAEQAWTAGLLTASPV
jgi:ATP-dependent protease ClpP protease subunit